MLIDQEGLRALIEKHVADYAGQPTDICVYWQGDPVPFMAAKAQVILDQVSVEGLGVDESVDTHDPLEDALITNQQGLRTFTIQIRVESDLLTAAFEIAERLRTRFFRRGLGKELNEMDLAFVSAGPTNVVSLVLDNREVTAAAIDVILAVAMNEQDDQPEHGGDYIRQVEPLNFIKRP